MKFVLLEGGSINQGIAFDLYLYLMLVLKLFGEMLESYCLIDRTPILFDKMLERYLMVKQNISPISCISAIIIPTRLRRIFEVSIIYLLNPQKIGVFVSF